MSFFGFDRPYPRTRARRGPPESFPPEVPAEVHVCGALSVVAEPTGGALNEHRFLLYAPAQGGEAPRKELKALLGVHACHMLSPADHCAAYAKDYQRATLAPPLAADTAAERLLFALRIYPNYRVDSRGPVGCLMTAIGELRPDIRHWIQARSGDCNTVWTEAYRITSSGGRVMMCPSCRQRSELDLFEGIAVGRQKSNQRTAEIHPDPAVRAAAHQRAEVWALAVLEVQSIRKARQKE